MSHTKDGFGPRTPKFFAFDVPDKTAGMYDGRPTNTRAKSPRKPAKLRSNSHMPVSGMPASATCEQPRIRRMAGTRRDTNANRRNGGGGMYDSSVMREGMMG
jgi:hypothetical protein